MIESSILFNSLRDTTESLAQYLEALEERAIEGGGFSASGAGRNAPRPDATAWSILALQAAGRPPESLAASRTWLATQQHEDGRVSLTPDHPTAAWPTPLSILAWHGSASHSGPQQRAVEFLLRFRGLAFPRSPLLGHDTTLVGWPWIESTHSWVEPTALGIMALAVTGHGGHTRALRAREVLIDRQLPQGGWNYGNTTAFGQTQRSAPDSTGMALSALAGLPYQEPEERASFETSLDYLGREVARVRSPLSLAWGLLGSSAWNRRPEAAVDWCRECLDRQATLGDYDTALLAVVLFAAHATTGLIGSLEGSRP